MRYVTREELLGHIHKPQLAALTEGVAGEPDWELVDLVNEDAAAEVDGYLRGIYRLPLEEPAPRIVRSVTASLMKFALYERRDAKNLPEEVFKLRKIAVDTLRDIQARRNRLDAAPAAESAEPGRGGAVVQHSPPQLFGTGFTGLFDNEFK